jgi:hypothetical protein
MADPLGYLIPFCRLWHDRAIEAGGMAIDDLPLPVVNFLNVIRVRWPYLNEDTVSQFASLREFTFR